MQNTKEDLIFAALVAQTVDTMRMEKAHNMTSKELEAFDSQSADLRVEEAMKRLESIADLIRTVQSRKAQA